MAALIYMSERPFKSSKERKVKSKIRAKTGLSPTLSTPEGEIMVLYPENPLVIMAFCCAKELSP